MRGREIRTYAQTLVFRALPHGKCGLRRLVWDLRAGFCYTKRESLRASFRNAMWRHFTKQKASKRVRKGETAISERMLASGAAKPAKSAYSRRATGPASFRPPSSSSPLTRASFFTSILLFFSLCFLPSFFCFAPTPGQPASPGLPNERTGRRNARARGKK